MRNLTVEETTLILHRKEHFDRFLEERMPVLSEFIETLGLPEPQLVLVHADRYVDGIARWISDQVILPKDRGWIITRMGYFVGEYLVQRFSGCWFVNEIPDSRFFSRYVVGEFDEISNANAMVDPFEVAEHWISHPVGRQLKSVLTTVETELRSA